MTRSYVSRLIAAASALAVPSVSEPAKASSTRWIASAAPMARARRIPTVVSGMPIVRNVTEPPCCSTRRRAVSTALAAAGSSSWGTFLRRIRLVPGSISRVTELPGSTLPQTIICTKGPPGGFRARYPALTDQCRQLRVRDHSRGRDEATRLSRDPLVDVAFHHHVQDFFAVIQGLIHRLLVVLHVSSGCRACAVHGLNHVLEILVELIGVRSRVDHLFSAFS